MEKELETRTNESSTYALTTGSNVLYETAPAKCLDLVHTEQQQQAAAQQQMTEQMASGSDSDTDEANYTITKVHFQALSGDKFTLNLPLDFNRFALPIGEAVSHKLAMSTDLFSLALGDTRLDMYKSISNLSISDGSVINIIFHDPIDDDDDDDDDTDKTWHTYQYIHQGKTIWKGAFKGCEWGEAAMWDMPGGQDCYWTWAEEVHEEGAPPLRAILNGEIINIDDLTDMLDAMTGSAKIEFIIDDDFVLDYGSYPPTKYDEANIEGNTDSETAKWSGTVASPTLDFQPCHVEPDNYFKIM